MQYNTLQIYIYILIYYTCRITKDNERPWTMSVKVALKDIHSHSLYIAGDRDYEPNPEHYLGSKWTFTLADLEQEVGRPRGFKNCFES